MPETRKGNIKSNDDPTLLQSIRLELQDMKNELKQEITESIKVSVQSLKAEVIALINNATQSRTDELKNAAVKIREHENVQFLEK